MGQDLLLEVKFGTGQIGLTGQLRDFVAFSKQNDLTFELIVREGTKLSRRVQKLVDEGAIVLKTISSPPV